MSAPSQRTRRGQFTTGNRASNGRPRGTQNRVTQDVQAIARGLVDNPTYRRRLLQNLTSGTLHPAVETMLWHYAYGKPKTEVEISGARPVLFQVLVPRPGGTSCA